MKTPDLEKIAAENKEEKNPQNTQKSPKIGFGDLGKNCGFLTSKPTPPPPADRAIEILGLEEWKIKEIVKSTNRLDNPPTPPAVRASETLGLEERITMELVKSTSRLDTPLTILAADEKGASSLENGHIGFEVKSNTVNEKPPTYLNLVETGAIQKLKNIPKTCESKVNSASVSDSGPKSVDKSLLVGSDMSISTFPGAQKCPKTSDKLRIHLQT